MCICFMYIIVIFVFCVSLCIALAHVSSMSTDCSVNLLFMV